MNTETYRRQHSQLERLLEILDRATSAENDLAIVSGLGRLRGVLLVNAWTKDKIMYPVLRCHPDPQMRERAKRHQEEMASVARFFAAFYERWCEPGALAHDRAAFAAEWKALREELSVQIDAEEQDLFDHVDALKLVRSS